MKKYQFIFKKIETDILNDIYKVGDFLPSEHKLMIQYAVSRDTIRKALNLLEKNHLIKKIRGQGSKILRNEQLNFPISHLTSYHELVKQLGISSKTNVVSFDFIRIDHKMAVQTGFKENQLVWRVVRQRIVENTAYILDTDYLDKVKIPNLTREICEHSIYHYIENALKLQIAYAQKEITIENVTDRDRILMNVNNDPFVVNIRSKVFLNDGCQFQYTESRHKIEKFRFVDIAHRIM